MLTHDDVREILRIIDESELDELHIETTGFELHVRKGGVGGDALPTAPAGDARVPASSAARPAADPPGREHDQASDGLVQIPSPMLGTFYRAESPGAEPFVEIGAEVGPDTTVCIIEVMKMMNSVPAGVSGTVEEVCPSNGELVEYGAPLFRVRPA
jgi:acetyl-CoA carboxylase biotin carboxyl carrier protein